MNKNYESPRFTFMELKLMERVANKCFGHSYVWLDLDENGVVDEDDISVPLGNGCGGNETVKLLNQIYRDKKGITDPNYNYFPNSIVNADSEIKGIIFPNS